MKKTFTLTHPKIKPDRLMETARHDINKYIRRERRKKLPDGVDYWDFDCRFGPTPEQSTVVHVSELTKCMDEIERRQLTSFYVEIIAKEGHRRGTLSLERDCNNKPEY